MVFSTGSKTFLIGEYSVLFGGSALVLVTPPKFRLQVTEGETHLIGIKENSPTYEFYKSRNFSNLLIEFFDPYNESGGMGASSAQFTLLYKAYLKMNRQRFNINSFLDEYKRLFGKNSAIIPSGTDCVAQYFDHHIFFNSKTRLVEKIEWKFSNIDYAIFRTGYKVNTYSHLQELTPIDTSKLQELTINAKESFHNVNEELFIKSIQNFFNLLKEKKLVANHTLKTVDEILKMEGVVAAKGCGALSADTIIVIFEKQKRNILIKTICDIGLYII